MYEAAADKRPSPVPEIIVDEGSSMYCADDVWNAFPESTVRRAEAEDLSVEEDEGWRISTSAPARRRHVVTSVHLLTPPCHGRCREQPRSRYLSAVYIVDKKDGDGNNDEAEFLDHPSFNTRDDVTAASQLTCSSEIAHSVIDEKGVQDSIYAAVGVAQDSDGSWNGSSVERSPSVDAGPADSAECDQLSNHHTSADRNFVSSAFGEVVADLRNTSKNVAVTWVDFERGDTVKGGHRDESSDLYESEDDKLSSLESKAASHLRFVTRLYVVLAADLSYYQTSQCSNNEPPFLVNVSSRIHQLPRVCRPFYLTIDTGAGHSWHVHWIKSDDPDWHQERRLAIR